MNSSNPSWHCNLQFLVRAGKTGKAKLQLPDKSKLTSHAMHQHRCNPAFVENLARNYIRNCKVLCLMS
jgi:hypothetical protein